MRLSFASMMFNKEILSIISHPINSYKVSITIFPDNYILNLLIQFDYQDLHCNEAFELISVTYGLILTS